MADPYFHDGDVTIYHGDCLELLDGLAADVAIIDPPYSDHVHRSSKRSAVHGAGISERRDLGFTSLTPALRDGIAAWIRASVRRWSLVFSDIESAHLWREAIRGPGVDYVRTCFWHKVNGAPQFTGDRPAVAFEAITATHPAGKKRWNGHGRQGLYAVPIVLDRNGSGGQRVRVHTTQKPEALLESLILDFSDPGELIIDPCMGSGTMLVAARRLGRRAIGIDCDERSCESAARRLSQRALGLEWASPWSTETTDVGALSPAPAGAGTARRDRVEAAARAHRAKYPEVFAALEALLLAEWRAGRKRWGVKAAFEVLRYRSDLRRPANEAYKINNSHAPIYARWVLEARPELVGFVETRERQS